MRKKEEFKLCLGSDSVVNNFATINNIPLVNVEGTGVVGVFDTTNANFGLVKVISENVTKITLPA